MEFVVSWYMDVAAGHAPAVVARAATTGRSTEMIDGAAGLASWLPAPVASAAVAAAAYYIVGTLALTLWPEFSRTVTRTVVRRPGRALVSGILLMLVVSALAVGAFTVLWIAGPFVVFALVWLPIALLALVYVTLAVFGGVLSLLGVDSPYAALAVGGVVPATLSWLPRDATIDLLFLAVLTLGGGAMLWSLWHRRRTAVE